MTGSSRTSGYALFGLLMSTLCAADDARPADELLRDMQLRLGKAYSECIAYYEVVGSDADHATGIDSAVADEMKREAQFRAAAHVADVESAADALHVLNADLEHARRHLASLKDDDAVAYTEEMIRLRTRCRMAVNDPPVFVERTLRAAGRNNRYIQLDPDLTVEKILQQAKPATKPMDIFKCEKPAIAHTLPLDDLLVEGGMICKQHADGVCDGERSWLSYPQYIQSRYPDSEVTGYSEKVTITFKGGKTQQVRTLTACVAAPQFRT